MIKRETVTEAMYNAIRMAATKMPPDVRKALQKALAEEVDPMAKKHLELSLKNADSAEKGCGLVCADTGFPMFFIHAGPKTEVEGGFGVMRECAEKAVAQHLRVVDGILRRIQPRLPVPVTRRVGARAADGDGPGNLREYVGLALQFRRPEQRIAHRARVCRVLGIFRLVVLVLRFAAEHVRRASPVCDPAVAGRVAVKRRGEAAAPCLWPRVRRAPAPRVPAGTATCGR